MWSRYCVPYWNTRVSPSREAGTAYPSRTHELVPHVEQVQYSVSEHMS